MSEGGEPSSLPGDHHDAPADPGQHVQESAMENEEVQDSSLVTTDLHPILPASLEPLELEPPHEIAVVVKASPAVVVVVKEQEKEKEKKKKGRPSLKDKQAKEALAAHSAVAQHTPPPATATTHTRATKRRALATAGHDGGEAAADSLFDRPAAEPVSARGAKAQAVKIAAVPAFAPTSDAFIQRMRDELVAHRVGVALGTWLSHQEKLWELHHIEKKGSALTYVPVTLRDTRHPAGPVDPAAVLVAAAPLIHNPAFISYRESRDLSSLLHFVPNIHSLAPDVTALLTPFYPNAAPPPLLPLAHLAHDDKAKAKRKANGQRFFFSFFRSLSFSCPNTFPFPFFC